MPRTSSIPNYRLHLKSGQAVVTLVDSTTKQRKDFYLGVFGSPQSQEEYDKVISGWIASGRRLPSEHPPSSDKASISFNEVFLAFVEGYCPRYAARAGNNPETKNYLRLFRLMRPIWGDTPVSAFGPKEGKKLQRLMIEEGWSRRHLNAQFKRLKHCLKWAGSEELIEGKVVYDSQSVDSDRPAWAGSPASLAACHGPNRSGRSREWTPVFTRHRMPSSIRRSSFHCPPRRGARGGKDSGMSLHRESVSARHFVNNCRHASDSPDRA